MGVALLLALAQLSGTPPAQSQTAESPATTTWTVPFLTSRNRTGDREPGDAFGDDRSTLSAGHCLVRRADLGSLGPLADQLPQYLREETLRIGRVTIEPETDVLDQLEVSAAGRGPALYVHGYYIGFEKGCRRAGLLIDNAGLAGRFLWFSWPSDGAIAYYTHDEADLAWSVPDIADTILELHRRFGPGSVDVLGHSLGGRGVMLALTEVAYRDPEFRLDSVVLLAPDADFGIFQRSLPRIAAIANNVTVYVADEDLPLAVSAEFHGYPRLGQTGNDVSVLTGVEVIDISDVPEATPSGHLYHIYSAEVGADLNLLLNDGLLAGDRPGLRPGGSNLWKLQPDAPD